MRLRHSFIVVIPLVIACSSGRPQVEEPGRGENGPEGCWAETPCTGATAICLTPGSPPCDTNLGCAQSVFPRATCGPARCPEGQICTDESACLDEEGTCMDDGDCGSRDLRCYYKPGGSGFCVRRACLVSEECGGYCVEGWCFEEPGFCSDASGE